MCLLKQGDLAGAAKFQSVTPFCGRSTTFVMIILTPWVKILYEWRFMIRFIFLQSHQVFTFSLSFLLVFLVCAALQSCPCCPLTFLVLPIVVERLEWNEMVLWTCALYTKWVEIYNWLIVICGKHRHTICGSPNSGWLILFHSMPSVSL